MKNLSILPFKTNIFITLVIYINILYNINKNTKKIYIIYIHKENKKILCSSCIKVNYKSKMGKNWAKLTNSYE